MIIKSATITPVKIEYVIVTRENLANVAEWCGGRATSAYVDFENYNREYSRVPIGWYLVKRPSGFQAMTSEEFAENVSPD